MPLRDHFRLPLSITHPWTAFHSSWANTISNQLNQVLPAEYYALPNVQLGGPVEIDVATLEKDGNGARGGGVVATAVWASPRPLLTAPVTFAALQTIEVQVFQNLGGPQLRAAIELVSPSNKDRPSSRRVFATKCGSYLQRGISVVVLDIVTERLANLHAEFIQFLEWPSELSWQSPTNLSAIAYRKVVASGRHQLEVWPEPIAVGAGLPTLPLWLDIDLCLPLPLEESYQATCEFIRIPG
jgi:hypothetical protein